MNTALKKESVWLRLGNINQFPLDQGRSFIINGRSVAVFRQRNGSINAISNSCPHLNGPLSEGLVGDGKVVCPLHGHRFDLMSGEGLDSCERVETYSVRLLGDELWIDSNPIRR